MSTNYVNPNMSFPSAKETRSKYVSPEETRMLSILTKLKNCISRDNHSYSTRCNLHPYDLSKDDSHYAEGACLYLRNLGYKCDYRYSMGKFVYPGETRGDGWWFDIDWSE